MPRECELHTRSRNEMESGATPEVVVRQDHPIDLQQLIEELKPYLIAAQQVDADADAPDDATAYLTKITMATIQTNPAAAKASQKQTRLAVILGQAFETEEVKKPYMPNVVFLSLKGHFEAWNLQDANPSQGQVYQSSILYLPEPYHTMLVSEVRAGGEKAKEVGIEFVYLIESIPAKNPSGYTYRAYSLLAPLPPSPLTKHQRRKKNRAKASDARLVSFEDMTSTNWASRSIPETEAELAGLQD
jgi:hypothetical protein